MRKYIAPRPLRLETPAKTSLNHGHANVKAENGRVGREGDDNAFMRANIMSR